jgi:hypothetical protein
MEFRYRSDGHWSANTVKGSDSIVVAVFLSDLEYHVQLWVNGIYVDDEYTTSWSDVEVLADELVDKFYGFDEEE